MECRRKLHPEKHVLCEITSEPYFNVHRHEVEYLHGNRQDEGTSGTAAQNAAGHCSMQFSGSNDDLGDMMNPENAMRSTAMDV